MPAACEAILRVEHKATGQWGRRPDWRALLAASSERKGSLRSRGAPESAEKGERSGRPVPSNNVEGRRMEGITDADLVRRSVAGERAAFEALVLRYWERLYVLAAHSRPVGASPEDVVQETFVRAWRGLGTLRDPSRVGSWLYTTALRVCREGRGARLEGGIAGEPDRMPSDVPDPSAAGLAAETLSRVRSIVERSTPGGRFVVEVLGRAGAAKKHMSRSLVYSLALGSLPLP